VKVKLLPLVLFTVAAQATTLTSATAQGAGISCAQTNPASSACQVGNPAPGLPFAFASATAGAPGTIFAMAQGVAPSFANTVSAEGTASFDYWLEFTGGTGAFRIITHGSSTCIGSPSIDCTATATMSGFTLVQGDLSGVPETYNVPFEFKGFVSASAYPLVGWAGEGVSVNLNYAVSQFSFIDNRGITVAGQLTILPDAPEPGTFLLGFAGLGLVWSGRRRR
jgi:uncharacterized protein (TIGR03382 family)